jgi:hypothetical protein
VTSRDLAAPVCLCQILEKGSRANGHDDKRSVAERMVFREVTHDNWRDFEGLFECRGGPKACWRMVWRASPIEAKQTDGLTRKTAMKARITAGTTVGLLGYLVLHKNS